MLFHESPEIEAARSFLLQKWQERAAEMLQPKPETLAGACKFASLFAEAHFGGQQQGNWHHQFVLLDGAILDLTGTHHPTDWYVHDRHFWHNPDHCKSLESCKPRVKRWLLEYRG